MFFLLFGAMAVPSVTFFFVFLPLPCTFFACASFPSRDWMHHLSSSVDASTSSLISLLRVGQLAGCLAPKTAAMRSMANVRHGSNVAFALRRSCSFCLIWAWKHCRRMTSPCSTSLRNALRTIVRPPTIAESVCSPALIVVTSPWGFVYSSRMAVSVSA
jgi:hypothetical protein